MGSSNSSLVSWAAQDGRVNDLIYHLEQAGPLGLKPMLNSPKKRTPLHLSAIGGHLQCISILFDSGSNLNETDTDGFTALHHAASNCHLAAVQLLIQLGASIETQTRFGVKPIHIAASIGHTPMLKVLISNGAYIDARESWGQTALMISTQRSRLDSMRELIQFGADPEIHDNHHGYTALHMACTTRDEETLLLLLDAYCDVHAVDNHGLSAVGVAIENKFYRGIPLLLEYGGRANPVDNSIATPGLQIHIQDVTSSPLSLARQSRVVLRKVLGPMGIQTKSYKYFPEMVQQYLIDIRDDCCADNEMKRHALNQAEVLVPTKSGEKKRPL